MKKALKIILIILGLCLVFVLTSCCGEPKQTAVEQRAHMMVYKGHRWDLIKINDSIYIAMPGLNADKTLVPTMFNIKSVELKQYKR